MTPTPLDRLKELEKKTDIPALHYNTEAGEEIWVSMISLRKDSAKVIAISRNLLPAFIEFVSAVDFHTSLIEIKAELEELKLAIAKEVGE